MAHTTAHVVLVGAGRIGQMRARLISSHPRMCVVCVVDVSRDAAQQLADTLPTSPAVPQVLVATDLAAALTAPELQRPSGELLHHTFPTANTSATVPHPGRARTRGPSPPDKSQTLFLLSLLQYLTSSSPHPVTSARLCVWICTTTSAHPAAISAAAQQRLPVFCEKPVAETPAEIAALYAECAQHGAPLVSGFQRRFDAAYTALLEQVHADGVGPPQLVHCAFRDHPQPNIAFLRTGGDPFTDLAPHDVDYVRVLLGEACPTPHPSHPVALVPSHTTYYPLPLPNTRTRRRCMRPAAASSRRSRRRGCWTRPC